MQRQNGLRAEGQQVLKDHNTGEGDAYAETAKARAIRSYLPTIPIALTQE